MTDEIPAPDPSPTSGGTPEATSEAPAAPNAPAGSSETAGAGAAHAKGVADTADISTAPAAAGAAPSAETAEGNAEPETAEAKAQAATAAVNAESGTAAGNANPEIAESGTAAGNAEPETVEGKAQSATAAVNAESGTAEVVASESPASGGASATAESAEVTAESDVESAPAAAPANPPPLSEDNTELLDSIRNGYTQQGPALSLGAAVIEDTAYPDAPVGVPLSVLNRHGLVAGATGTGKTKTLQLMAEQLSAQGVPVFLADVKGDLSGIASPGEGNEKITERSKSIGQEWTPTAYPTEFFSLGGLGKGIPIRATITDFGPTLLSKVLGLNDTQESSLGLIFYYADKNGLALLDLKDLRAVTQHLVSDEGKAELKALGGLSSATAGVILRQLIAFEEQGADVFFGEPAFETADLVRTTADGKGLVSCLELPGVQDKPALFSTFLMWLLAELFQGLPEVGDVDKPKMVFFFDEAHLLFADASKPFLESIEQTVKLIRSKGIGVFFVTQSPKDVPAGVLAQLGNRVQHALRAFTPDDSKALRSAVKTYPHTAYDLEKLLTSLGTGEAVVTVLSPKGAPTPVAWTRMGAPQSLMAPSPEAVLNQVIAGSPIASKYAESIDRESAFEILAAKAKADADAEAAAGEDASDTSSRGGESAKGGKVAKAAKDEGGMVSQMINSPAVKSALRSAGTVIGREITRSLFGTRRRRR